jgi:tyrosinase
MPLAIMREVVLCNSACDCKKRPIMDVSRRFLFRAAACLGLSSRLFSLFEDAAAANPVRLRQNIKIFAEDPGKVRALRGAVRRMKERSAANRHDPFGWSYWAASHGTLGLPSNEEPKDPNGRPLYRQCKHGGGGVWEPHFLSWHRPFLFFFEAVLKQAAVEANELTAFELPYWNWYVDPLPVIFAEGDAQTNPLLHTPRGGVVDLTQVIPGLETTPFERDDFLIRPGVPKENTFLYKFDENPHGTVHDLVAGDMGRIVTAAWDPIFWLHHANLDRLWSAWMSTGTRRVPSATSAWGNESWFFDSAGKRKSRAGDTLKSEAPFGYRYDDESLPTALVTVASAPSRTIEAEPPAAAIARRGDVGRTFSQTGAPVVLGNDAVTVKLKIAPGQSRDLMAVSSASKNSQGALIVLQDIEIGEGGKEGGFHYNIVALLNPADGGKPRRIKLGSIGTFSLSVAAHQTGHKHNGKDLGKQTLTFPLNEVLTALGPIKAKDLEDGLQISLEPVQPAAPGSPEIVKIGAVKLQGSSPGLRDNR